MFAPITPAKGAFDRYPYLPKTPLKGYPAMNPMKVIHMMLFAIVFAFVSTTCDAKGGGHGGGHHGGGPGGGHGGGHGHSAPSHVPHT